MRDPPTVRKKAIFASKMSCRNAQNLKNILRLFTAAYAAHATYSLICKEKRKTARKRRQRRTLLQKVVKEKESTSSEDECEESSLTDINEPACRTEVNQPIPIPASNASEEETKICDPRTIKIERISPLTANGQFVESIVSTFSDDKFKRNFRVSRKTMDRLNELFKISTEFKNIQSLAYNMKIPENYYMMMFLWFVGKRCSFLQLSKTFNVPMSRSVGIIDTVIQFLENCAADYIRFPNTPSEKRLCAERFQEFAAFPDVIGCLVNTYTKSQGSISTVQVICDSQKRFLDVHFDTAHRVHHAQMLQTSPVSDRLKELCQGRYHILAGGEYHVREWLLTPYKEPISTAQKLYNMKHRKTLEAVSCSLDELKFRFKQLTSMPSFSTSKMKKIIIPCCVLHNICLSEGDYFDTDTQITSLNNDEIDTEVAGAFVADDPHLRKMGELKRRQIMEALQST